MHLIDRIEMTRLARDQIYFQLGMREPDKIDVFLGEKSSETTITALPDLGSELKSSEELLAVASMPDMRSFWFENQQSLHEFQEALTGFRVLFDSLHAQLQISRSIFGTTLSSNTWTSPAEAGIQLLRRKESGALHLVAFFGTPSRSRYLNIKLPKPGMLAYENHPESSRQRASVRSKHNKSHFPNPNYNPRIGQLLEETFIRMGVPEVDGDYSYITVSLPTLNKLHWNSKKGQLT